MSWFQRSCAFLILYAKIEALHYDPSEVEHNINTNQTARDALDYWGEWPNHTFNPSPPNWRVPFYTVLLDRFANGNPTNDNANDTQFEHDVTQTQLRHGGDIKGLQDSLDYLQGMGIKVLYLAGSPHINVPWAADGYSPLDLTLLDYHFGTISEWQAAIDDIHQRGMYLILDNTMSTMGDLIGFEGYLNVSTPFNPREHNALWKGERRYNDFTFGNNELPKCDYPRFYGDDGMEVFNSTNNLIGCRDSDFDQYGEVAAFGDYPEWQRQISKFAFVQDRLREWRPDVLARIERFSCMTLATLDIDGYRIDKGLTITVDAQAHWSRSIRSCAKRYGKENFYISGEVVAGNTFGSVYVGRGRTPDNYAENVTQAVTLTQDSDSAYFLRDKGLSAFDGVAFHYTVYRYLSRFLGLDGTYTAEGDPPDVDWIEFWQTILLTNDLINANDGTSFDPRHMYGVTNQDVFRWPTITNGTQKQLLGYFIVALVLPGIPTLVWGEEQAFYILDSTNSNYVFGRSPMTSTQAWSMHGCYNKAIGNSKYYEWPIEAGLHGCQDEWVPLDHRDPSHPVRNFIKSTHEMREQYPVFQDGFSLRLLSNQTYQIFLPGSNHTPTETGLWSIERAGLFTIQESLTQIAWLVFTNENHTTDKFFNCSDTTSALTAPFSAGSTVKNTYFPYDEYTLEESSKKMDTNSNVTMGCLSRLQLPAWGFKAFVLKVDYVNLSPVITKFLPGHDYRMVSTPSIPIEIQFSAVMDCQQVRDALRIDSTTSDGQIARLDPRTIICRNESQSDSMSSSSGSLPTTWSFAASLIDVSDGIHQISINNVSTFASGSIGTNSHDHFLIRVGQRDNPMVFPSANYSSDLMFKGADKNLYVKHKAAGADMFRYSINFGTTYSDWEVYPGGASPISTLAPKVWSGTKLQKWNGEHVIMQYWNRLTGSSNHVQQADVGTGSVQRQIPHAFVEGTFNQHGFDEGFSNEMRMVNNNQWRFDFVHEWPAQISVNVWGINPDGQPDLTRVYGDVDGDFVLDRIPPNSLIKNVINLTESPPHPFLGWQINLNDADYRFHLRPVGSRWCQLILFVLLWMIPVLTGAAAVWAFMRSFYRVKHNDVGIVSKKGLEIGDLFQFLRRGKAAGFEECAEDPQTLVANPSDIGVSHQTGQSQQPSKGANPKRLTVLIATMEYDIEDWGIKVKIGGLGVMSSLMGKNLKHQDLIWVIPCIGGEQYPTDRPTESIAIKVLGSMYEIKTQYHVVENITYVLLDAPIFRKQTKAEPYPTRMDDLESAVYYSAWNSCIAEMMRRFPIDLYHINDYHGAVAPLHMLPRIVPCLLSLHNAEFQGLWPMRSASESQEICEIYNLDPAVVQKYIRFGEVFNLLHAGASYLRIHQKGFGAVGVSTKYGKRAFARYPIFWGMKDIGGLPNPDPTDTAAWSGEHIRPEEISVDQELEASKSKLKRQAQNWAGLKQDPEAELFVFVGRWSNQKGVDAIADVFPSIMERHPRVQLICVGPVIDLYGKFAAIKLARMMEVYQGRVFSNPEFTALPPYIFSGADFALMPSRDEPFGLVAVEFGRKGVLCVGARVGGLGNMPGWWFTIESTTTKHFIHQFRMAIEDALKAKPAMRAIMRARAIKQRFPVSQWVEDLEKLQASAIEISHKQAAKDKRPILESPNTPAILETRGIMSVLQSRFTKPVLRPRPAATQAPVQAGGLSSIAEGLLLAAPGPGLGSTLGPSSRRKPPPPLLLGNNKIGLALQGAPATNKQLSSDPPINNSIRRPSVVRVPSTPNLSAQFNPPPKAEVVMSLRRPSLARSPSMPQLREDRPPNRGKAVKMLGMQVPASRAGASTAPKHPLSSINDSAPLTDLPPKLNKINREPTKGFVSSALSSSRRPVAPLPSPIPKSDAGSETSLVPSLPQVQPNRQKAVKLLGVELPALRAKALTSPKQPISSSRHRSVSPSSATSIEAAPTLANTKESTPASSPPTSSKARFSTKSSTPVSSPTTSSRARFSTHTTTTAATSISNFNPNVINAPRAIDMFPSLGPHYFPYGAIDVLSTSEVEKERPDNVFQDVEPFFSDPEKEYETVFTHRLKKLNGKNSETQLCIEEYLLDSEKSWFGRLRSAQLGKVGEGRPPEDSNLAMIQEIRRKAGDDEFHLGDDYKPPSGLKKIMRKKVGDWPVYSFLLAFGQIIAANSYQITLLNGTVGEPANKLYIIASIYLATSLVWWILYRRLQTVFVVSLPFLFYGLAFLLIGFSPLGPSRIIRDWLHNIATGFYAVASSSGALYFAVNFADEGGAPVTTFVYRACVIQGTQQLYVVALWYWGAALAKSQGTNSVVSNLNSYPKIIVPVCVAVAFLMWGVGFILWTGLPPYYHQKPGNIPSFYSSLFRRKIILWFFVVVMIQNYWLSAPYGHNWVYLWSSQILPVWEIVILIIVFFVVIWIVILYIFNHMSKSHSWVLPIFAIGLGAPRWAQILWSTSNMGQYLPWTSGPVASALAGRSLWLWLGVLDAVQGVGFGMILLQTLTRFHVLFTLIAAQILGSFTTILARATAPDRIGPGTVFPNLCINPKEALSHPWFWIALLFQLAVPVGFGIFFRKEQLSKA